MANTSWDAPAFCAGCDETVTIHWTRIVSKRADGTVEVDMTTGSCDRGHQLTG